MKSRVNANIAKKATESLMKFVKIDENIERVDFSFLGKSAIEAALDNRLIMKSCFHDLTDDTYIGRFRTLGGVDFPVIASDIKELVEEANKYFEKPIDKG